MPAISDDNRVVTLSPPASLITADSDGIDWSISPPGEKETHRVRLSLNGAEVFDGRITPSHMTPALYGITPTTLIDGEYVLELLNRTTGSHASTNFTVPGTMQIIINIDPAGFEVNTNMEMIPI